MWRPDRTRLVKVLLHAQGEDVETSWGEDCGPAPAPPGARFVRLGNVPFLHAKPTYGDVLAACPDEDGLLCWDRAGVPWERIGERLVEDDGRWAMILDYELLDPAGDPHAAFDALDAAGERRDIAVEGCFGARPGRPGRAYLAIPSDQTVDEVLAYLHEQKLPLAFSLVHPVEEEDGDLGA